MQPRGCQHCGPSLPRCGLGRPHKAACVIGKIPLLPSPTPGEGEQAYDFTHGVRRTGDYADLPQTWFRNFNSTFAASRLTQSLIKFPWAVSKLQASLMDTIGTLCDKPTTITPSIFPSPAGMSLTKLSLVPAQGEFG